MADERDDLDGKTDTKSNVGDLFGVSSGKKKKKKKKVEASPEPAGLETPSSAADDAVAALEADVLGDDEATKVVAKKSVKKKPADAPTEEPKPKKAKAKKPAPVEDDEAEAEEAPKPKAKAKPKAAKVAEDSDEVEVPAKKKKSTAAVDGVFRSTADDDAYLNASDLGDYEDEKPKKSIPWVGIGVVAGLFVLVAGGLVALSSPSDIGALMKGELREKRIAEARALEEAHEADQLAKLEVYGNLMINGNPKYALVKLNGQVQYGLTSQGWREVRIGTAPGIQDLRVKANHTVEVTAPGFQPMTVEVTEGKWESGSTGHVFMVNPSLAPTSTHAKQEFDARMSQDTENEFYGKVTLNSTPVGAKVIWDNKPLLNEKGEELVTPVTFDKYWTKDESGKLEEHVVRVDTTLDIGHKVQVVMEYESSCPDGAAPACGEVDNCCPADCDVATDSDCKWPKYITSITRPMWTCTWNTKDGNPPETIPKDKTIQHFCDYAVQLDVDLAGLKSYIIAREEERKKVLEQMGGGAEDAEASAETASK